MVLSRPDDWDLARFTIGGASSGACVALAVAAQQPRGVLRAAAMLYPPVELASVVSEESKRVRAIPPGNPGHALALKDRTL